MRRVVIAGAAGRDFHNFNVAFRGGTGRRGRRLHGDADPRHRRPRLPAGARRRPATRTGIPILPEEELSEPRPAREAIDEVVFAYSDVTHEHVMHLGSICLAAGADFRL